MRPFPFLRYRKSDTVSKSAEKVRQRLSRFVQTLNVPQRVRLGPSLAAALLNSLFEHSSGEFFSCPDREGYRNAAVPK